MSSPLPLRPSIDHTPHSKTVIHLCDDDSAAVFETFGSETARAILEALEADPATVSDLADAVDTSLQNVDYHLQRLCDADLVTEVGTWYSEKGNTMCVYAPTSERIELRLSTEQQVPPSHP